MARPASGTLGRLGGGCGTLIDRADQQQWLERLEAEHDNLRAALDWSDDGEDGERGLRLAGALWRFWEARGHFAEGRNRLSRALDRCPEADSAARAKALNGAGFLAYRQGDYATAAALHEESLAIRQELGDRGGIAASLGCLGLVAYNQGDYSSAKTLHEDSLAINRELGNRGGIAYTLDGLAAVAAACGNWIRAEQLWGAAEGVRQEIGAPMPHSEQQRYERYVATARASLIDKAAFDSAWQEGRAMTMEQAIEYALTERG